MPLASSFLKTRRALNKHVLASINPIIELRVTTSEEPHMKRVTGGIFLSSAIIWSMCEDELDSVKNPLFSSFVVVVRLQKSALRFFSQTDVFITCA